MPKTYHGTCHCGTVKFEVDLDLSAGTFRCNCSVCGKSRAWLAGVPESAFRLTAGKESLADYQFAGHRIHHKFCSKCGIKVFGQQAGAKPGEGGYAVSVSCLDDATPEELAAAPIQYFDGKHDRFDRGPEITSYL